MLDRTSLDKVKECLHSGQRFVLTTHVNPDGDGLGSEAALAGYLNAIGKDVYIYNSNPVPHNYRFLDPQKEMQVYKPETHQETLLTADFLLVLDISDWHRLRRVGEDIKDTRIKKICIDHHPPHERFGDVRLVNVDACSTGEIIYYLIKHCRGTITKEMAVALYTSILTDTGSFKFSNTNKSAFSICSELVTCGVVPHKIYQNIYERQSVSKVKLFGAVLRDLHFEEDGRVVWFKIPQKLMLETGAKPYDTDGFADYPRVIDGVEISVMFIEIEKDRFKVSFRSKGNYVVNGVAKKFGGGGHKFAAGLLLEGNLDEYLKKILHEVSSLFKK